MKCYALPTFPYPRTPRLYGPLTALASLIMDAHSSLSTAFYRHLLNFISRTSFSTSSSHLTLGLPLLLLLSRLLSNILHVLPSSIISTCPIHSNLFVLISVTIWVKRDQLDVTCFIISLFNAQHVSDVNTSILRSLQLMCWVIPWVVLIWFGVCWCYVVVWLWWCGIRMQAEALVHQPAYGYHTTTAKPQRNTNTHRTRAIQPMK